MTREKNKVTECRNKKHYIEGKYFYACKECWFDEIKRGDKPYGYTGKHGFEIPIWCKCPAKCEHNTFTCTECWKPVSHQKDGTYWFVGRERTILAG